MNTVIDFVGGYGSTLLGHNHPDVRATLSRALASSAPVHTQASVHPAAVELAFELNELLKEHCGEQRRFVMTPCNTGTEAVEAAIKHALMEWNERKRRAVDELEELRCDTPDRRLDEHIDVLLSLTPEIVAIEGSFHGKTAGSVSVTANPQFKEMYGASPLRVRFLASNDDLVRLRAKLAPCLVEGPVPGVASFSSVAAILFESIQGEGGEGGLRARSRPERLRGFA